MTKGIHKLNLGCGGVHVEGYINIDVRIPKGCPPDYQCDITKLPYKKCTIEEIRSTHVIEHMGRHEASSALKHWYEMLQYGGSIYLVTPDLEGTIKSFIAGDEGAINVIYGLQRHPHDYHKFCYTEKSLKELLLSVGFKTVFTTIKFGNVEAIAYK